MAQPPFLTAFVRQKSKAPGGSPFVCSLRVRAHSSDVEPANAEGYLRRLETKSRREMSGVRRRRLLVRGWLRISPQRDPTHETAIITAVGTGRQHQQ